MSNSEAGHVTTRDPSAAYTGLSGRPESPVTNVHL